MSSARTSPLAMILLALAFWLPSAAHSAGPGLGNLSYTTDQIFKPLSILKSNCTIVSGVQQCPNQRGEGTVMMYDGYLFVPFGKDSGVSGGGFAFWDISNPRAPVEVKKMDVPALREPHGYGFTGRLAAMQAINGVQFWDFTNPLAPVLVKYMTLPGIAESDYALGNWWVFWQAPYMYIGGSGNGLYIINTTDPANPVHVKTIPTAPGAAFAWARHSPSATCWS